MRNDISPGENRYVVRSVTRALDVLIGLSELNRPATAMELAAAVGLHPTTTIRMLESLRARGFIRLADDAYELGPKALDVGNAFVRRLSIAQCAQELAEDLASRVNETASVGVLDEGRVLYVAIAHGQQELGIQSLPYARHPLHCTALGKALLSALPWAAARPVLESQARERLTDNTLVDLAALKQELERTMTRGYAIDNEERVAGVFCIGAPIRDHLGRVAAAISVSGPAFRMKKAGANKLGQLVVQAAGEASRRLGAGEAPVAQARPRRRAR